MFFEMTKEDEKERRTERRYISLMCYLERTGNEIRGRREAGVTKLRKESVRRETLRKERRKELRCE